MLYIRSLFSILALAIVLLGISLFAHPLSPGVVVREEKPAFEPQAHLLFFGDMFFDRSVRLTMERKGEDYIFSCLADKLQEADVVVGNLEGPITTSASVSVGTVPGSPDNYSFTFATTTATLLARHNITVVNLGNNHMLNRGMAGASSTVAYLRAAGVEYFGDPIQNRNANIEANGVYLTFINYNEFGEKAGAAATTLQKIQDARRVGVVPIVYTHWGIEYATTSAPYQRELAHQFIDAGAELVVGSHPHVVEESEEYKGKYIYYSLGNAIFDQYWNEDVSHGLLLGVVISKSGVQKITEIPIVIGHDGRPCVDTPPVE